MQGTTIRFAQRRGPGGVERVRTHQPVNHSPAGTRRIGAAKDDCLHTAGRHSVHAHVVREGVVHDVEHEARPSRTWRRMRNGGERHRARRLPGAK